MATILKHDLVSAHLLI